MVKLVGNMKINTNLNVKIYLWIRIKKNLEIGECERGKVRKSRYILSQKDLNFALKKIKIYEWFLNIDMDKFIFFRRSLWGPLASFPLITRVACSRCPPRGLHMHSPTLVCVGRQGSPWTIGCKALSLTIAVGPLGPCTIFCRVRRLGVGAACWCAGSDSGTSRLVLGVKNVVASADVDSVEQAPQMMPQMTEMTASLSPGVSILRAFQDQQVSDSGSFQMMIAFVPRLREYEI